MKIPTEFVYKDHKYQIKQMSGIDQCMLATRISPLVLPVLAVSIREGVPQKLAGVSDLNSTEGLKVIVEAGLSNVETLAYALNDVPEKTMRRIYEDCMKPLWRQGGEGLGWQQVFNEESGRLLYDDIEGVDVMSLSVEVVKDQLGNFIPALLSAVNLGALLSAMSQ